VARRNLRSARVLAIARLRRLWCQREAERAGELQRRNELLIQETSEIRIPKGVSWYDERVSNISVCRNEEHLGSLVELEVVTS
jgi:hypothetical protein